MKWSAEQKEWQVVLHKPHRSIYSNAHGIHVICDCHGDCKWQWQFCDAPFFSQVFRINTIDHIKMLGMVIKLWSKGIIVHIPTMSYSLSHECQEVSTSCHYQHMTFLALLVWIPWSSTEKVYSLKLPFTSKMISMHPWKWMHSCIGWLSFMSAITSIIAAFNESLILWGY